jgi:hypothetical protein
MVLQCEHFIYALFPHDGYELIKSPRADKILSEDNFRFLMGLGNGIKEERTEQFWFPTEQILAVSYLCPVKDEQARQGFWNHTILVRSRDLADEVLKSAIHPMEKLPSSPLECLMLKSLQETVNV